MEIQMGMKQINKIIVTEAWPILEYLRGRGVGGHRSKSAENFTIG